MITLGSVFTKTILDPNNKNVCDINEGLRSNYSTIIDTIIHNEDARNEFIVGDFAQAQPDLIAKRVYSSMDYWYWFLLSNFVEDPFKEVQPGYSYSKYNPKIIDLADTKVTAKDSTSRIGSVVTLN